MSINLRFKTTSVMGLLLWYGNINRYSDFLSLGIENGYLHLTYNVGNGEVSLLYNATRVNDGHWHRVNIFRFVYVGRERIDYFSQKFPSFNFANVYREVYAGSLMVDHGDSIVDRSNGPLRQINADTGLYIGTSNFKRTHPSRRGSFFSNDVFILYAGGVDNALRTTHNKYLKGVKGCISDFVLNSDYHVKLSWKQEDVSLCE